MTSAYSYTDLNEIVASRPVATVRKTPYMKIIRPESRPNVTIFKKCGNYTCHIEDRATSVDGADFVAFSEARLNYLRIPDVSWAFISFKPGFILEIPVCKHWNNVFNYTVT